MLHQRLLAVFILKRLNTNFIDVSHILNEIRLIKSRLEIKKIEYVCKITSYCYQLLPNRLKKYKTCITERDAVRELKLLLIIDSRSCN